MSDFKIFYTNVTGEDQATDDYPEQFGHERSLFLPGNIGLKRDTNGDIITETYDLGTEEGTRVWPVLEKDNDAIAQKVDGQLALMPNAKHGVLNLETPFMKFITGDYNVNYRKRAIDTIIDTFEFLKTNYPDIKWTNYNMPNRKYWRIVDKPTNEKKAHLQEFSDYYNDLAGVFDWLCPAAYDGYNYDAYPESQQNEVRNREIEYCKSAKEIGIRYTHANNLNIPIFTILYHAYRAGGKYSSVNIEPDPAVTLTPFPVYNQTTHGGGGTGDNGVATQTSRGWLGMYLDKPLPLTEWMEEWVKPTIMSGNDGLVMWHWNNGFFSWCFNTNTNSSYRYANEILLRRARIRWWMSIENDFGFTPYTAPDPTNHSAWTTGTTSTETREKMREYFKLMLTSRMDAARQFANSIKPPFNKPYSIDDSVYVNPDFSGATDTNDVDVLNTADFVFELGEAPVNDFI
jgi:hypothetical protein